MAVGNTTVLRRAADVIELQYPGPEGPLYVLQFGEADQNLVFRKGGALVFDLLALCDGHTPWSKIRAELERRYDGPPSLWSERLPRTIDDLIAWRAVEVVS